MPPEAPKGMWGTIGRCRPWTGVVKNRRKNGDHCWVKAHDAPIVDCNKPVGWFHLSVQSQLTQAERFANGPAG